MKKGDFEILTIFRYPQIRNGVMYELYYLSPLLFDMFFQSIIILLYFFVCCVKKGMWFFFRWMWLFRIESSASILYVDFMQKPNHWWIYLPVLTLYRSQIGKSATQQPNRTGDFLTLYRSQISKSAMQNPNRQVTYRVYTEVKLVNRRCSSVTIR